MEIKLKENIEDVGGSDGFWYDLTKGGYFGPEDVMSDPEQIKEMQKAINLVQQLEEIYQEHNES